jgi:predicted nucleotidyltransferase
MGREEKSFQGDPKMFRGRLWWFVSPAAWTIHTVSARLRVNNILLNGHMSEKLLTEAGLGLSELAKRFGIRIILQFGSTVIGPTHDESDLDLAIQLDAPVVSLETILEMQEALQAQFPGREVDVAILNRADPLFRKKVMEACRVLLGTPQDFARLHLQSFKA